MTTSLQNSRINFVVNSITTSRNTSSHHCHTFGRDNTDRRVKRTRLKEKQVQVTVMRLRERRVPMGKWWFSTRSCGTMPAFLSASAARCRSSSPKTNNDTVSHSPSLPPLDPSLTCNQRGRSHAGKTFNHIAYSHSAVVGSMKEIE